MEIKDMTMTNDTDADGREIVSEINATYTETRADGTQVEAEITTTADAEDPTQIEGHILMTETAPDGTETVTEIVTNEDGSFIVEDESLLEETVEAMFDVEIEDDLTPITPEEFSDDTESDVFQAESDFQTDDADFTVGDEMLDPNALPTDVVETPVADAPFDVAYGTTDDTFSETPIADTPFDSTLETTETDSTDAETLAQEAHAQAATDAQESADAFIAEGDYAAAAEAREVAENESWEAGDDSMLSLYDAQDLSYAAEKQEDAAYYEQQQATLAQQGDYEGAREAASNAAYATSNADISAGGADHTGQADAEQYNMDWAVHEEKQADYYADNAAAYAADGDFEKAEMYAASAADHQERADDFGDLGEHGGDVAVYDPSSEVAAGGTYDSTFDAAAVDTGFDSGMDTSVDTGYDSGADDI